jgi:hypothetical protein
LNQIFQHKATFFHGGPVNSTDNGFLEIVPITRKAFFHSYPTAYEISPVVAHGLDARTKTGDDRAGRITDPALR